MPDIVDTYRSIPGRGTGVFKDNGSRFLAFAYPVETEEEVKRIVDSLKKEYHDARHHCFAYRLGCSGGLYRANDDGEPSSSAGRPILGQIDSAGLSDVLVVVVRYFGGIKLGIPGLIRAYRSSTADALSSAGTCEKISAKIFRISFDYLNMNDVMRVIKDMSLEIIHQDFSQECAMVVKVRLSYESSFRERVAKILSCVLEEL